MPPLLETYTTVPSILQALVFNEEQTVTIWVEQDGALAVEFATGPWPSES